MTAGSAAQGSGTAPAERYGLRLLLLVGAVAAIAIPFATLTFNVLAEGPLIGWDGAVADGLNGWVHERRPVLLALESLSVLGQPLVLTVFVIAGAMRCRADGRNRPAVFLLATTASGAILGTVVKLVVDRPRPVVDHPVSSALGDSFPSGHAMHSTIVYGALLLALLPLVDPRLRRRLTALAILAVVAIGSSRLLLGVHFLTDVVGGHLLGAAWLAAGAAAFETWRDEVPVTDRQQDALGSSASELARTYGPEWEDAHSSPGR